MICADVAALLPEYIRRRLPAGPEAAVRAHLSACPACAAIYEDELAFGALARGTDISAPPYLMTRVMVSVRATPRQEARYRVRALDVVCAIAAALVFAGLVFGLRSLWTVTPLFADLFDASALLADGLTLHTIALAALWAVVGLSMSLPVAAIVHASIMRSRRAPLWWSKL